ncbi:hypothetical protein [Paenibacillus polymyxa]|uniref:Uncharacterized protein n=1 Tax=Paenibacillus polymyxa TaxID=1406 RepID=A0A378XWD6_PAEPO|nr:hypothetical protein [Paenibacillus polymyxa]MBE7897959.1 hypothetical protein [Paenibacillus polymyxa]MCC3259348.1 hypothetical protein [Paenibacillus polymyxa]MCJ1221251.1 hypothetical protein [Paenibacillus polymyxa]QPK51664.1 hypothetical protein G7035_02335 [Paenibacillus polymyxa]QPK56752.1 hypothetical protein G7L40_02340 [Paenibacillus polymyxa]
MNPIEAKRIDAFYQKERGYKIKDQRGQTVAEVYYLSRRLTPAKRMTILRRTSHRWSD